MPQNNNKVLRKALVGGGLGFGAGAVSDLLARMGVMPAPFGYNPQSAGGQWALDRPVAAPLLRGLAYAAPMAILAALAEKYKQSQQSPDEAPLFPDEMLNKHSVDHNSLDRVEELVKSASMGADDREELLAQVTGSYIKENADQLIKECNHRLDEWAAGFVKECQAAGKDSEELLKEAAFPLLALPFLAMGAYGAGKHGIGAARSFSQGRGTEGLKHLGHAGLNALYGIPMLGPAARGLGGLARIASLAGRTGKVLQAPRAAAGAGRFARVSNWMRNKELSAAQGLGRAFPGAASRANTALTGLQASSPYQRVAGSTLGKLFNTKAMGGPGFFSAPNAAYMYTTMTAPGLIGQPGQAPPAARPVQTARRPRAPYYRQFRPQSHPYGSFAG